MKSQAPEKYHSQIVPTYRTFILVCKLQLLTLTSLLAIGCHRIIINYGYMDILKNANFDLNFDGIAEVTETGLVTKTGRYCSPLTI